MRATCLAARSTCGARETWACGGTATRATASGSGGPVSPVAPPPPPDLRRLPPPPPSLLYLLRTGRTSNAAHAIWAAVLDGRSGVFAVDATAGLGGDTVGLARCLGSTGRVLALDLQPSALAATAAALVAAGADPESPPLAPVDLVLACHSTLSALLAACERPLLANFNLGYLPAAGTAGRGTAVAAATATSPATTMPALTAAAASLAPGGVITVASYVGHPGGLEEAASVSAFLGGLDPGTWVVSETRQPNRPGAPRLGVAYKKE